MNIDRLKYLFWQRYSGKITPEEEQEFAVFVKEPENQALLETCIEAFLEQSPDLPPISQEKAEGVLSRILSPMEVPSARIRTFRKWGWVAAAAIVAGIGFFLIRPRNSVLPPVAGHEQLLTEIPPGGNKAVLTLADGTSIALDSTANGSIAQQGNTRIIQAPGGKLAYDAGASPSRQAPGSEILYNRVTTPRGGQYQVVLPDGTKVWLNAASSIKFPTTFTGSSRTVELTGEAYLEVSKNKHQPFRVMTNGIEIAVLGTTFNVNAYTDEASVNTTLLEGSIAVASVVLRSGQQAQVQVSRDNSKQPQASPDNGKQPQANPNSGLPPQQQPRQKPVIIDGVDLDRVVAWKNGRFNFNGADVYAVMRQLSRWYDLTIQFEGEAPKLKLKGEMGRDLDLSEMLDLLREMGIKFKINGRTLIVSK